MGQKQVANLTYIKVSGGNPPGEIKSLVKDIDVKLDQAKTGLEFLIDWYLNDTHAYRAIPGPEKEGQEREYDYLSRWKEWAHLNSGDDL